MEGRIGALHVRYRLPAAGSIGSALAPAIDRAIQSGLADALGKRLAAAYDVDPAVVVIRELTARTVLGRGDSELDSLVVERMSRSSADAVASALSADPDPESIVTFADQAEFVGSFIVDVLRGSAWEHWYYGAFGQYRRSHVRATIEAVLADCTGDVPQIFAWLARRGQLDNLVAVLGAAATRRTLMSNAHAPTAIKYEVVPLTAAAFRLLAGLGWAVGDVEAEVRYIDRYLATAPVPPVWQDTRALTEWTLGFVRFVAGDLRLGNAPRFAERTETIEALLAGSLDWLDGSYAAKALAHLSAVVDSPHGSVTRLTRSLLVERHDRSVSRVAEQVREGRLRFERGADRDALVVRLVAALAEALPDESPLDRSLLAAIERIADVWQAANVDAPSPDDRSKPEATVTGPNKQGLPGVLEAASVLEPLLAIGPGATALASALIAVTRDPEEAGEVTLGAGLYLLARALADVRLPALARAAEVPLAPLLGALAMQWLRLQPPFDGPTALWTGTLSPDFAALENPGVRLADLEDALNELLADQHWFANDSDDAASDGSTGTFVRELPCGDVTSLTVARIAAVVLRVWTRWLPGFGAASASFIVEKCLSRAGRVRFSESVIHVQLAPAPLDVVLEMAGYFRPIENAVWLGGRTIRFELQRDGNG